MTSEGSVLDRTERARDFEVSVVEEEGEATSLIGSFKKMIPPISLISGEIERQTARFPFGEMINSGAERRKGGPRSERF